MKSKGKGEKGKEQKGKERETEREWPRGRERRGKG